MSGSLPPHRHPATAPRLLSLCPLSTVTATGRPWQAQTLMLSLSAPHLRPRLCRNLAHRTKGNRWCTTVHGMTSVSVGWGGLTVISTLTAASRGRGVGGGGRGEGEGRRSNSSIKCKNAIISRQIVILVNFGGN